MRVLVAPDSADERVRQLNGNQNWGKVIGIMSTHYDLAGDHEKARAAYKDFLTLWKDADPDIAVLKEAKAEYRKLQ